MSAQQPAPATEPRHAEPPAFQNSATSRPARPGSSTTTINRTSPRRPHRHSSLAAGCSRSFNPGVLKTDLHQRVSVPWVWPAAELQDQQRVPEATITDQIDDCLAAARWVAAVGPTRFRTGRLLLGGISAGAHLAMTIMLRMRDDRRRWRRPGRCSAASSHDHGDDGEGEASQRDGGPNKVTAKPSGSQLSSIRRRRCRSGRDQTPLDRNQQCGRAE
jgi:alpha/beta hydrolase fold